MVCPEIEEHTISLEKQEVIVKSFLPMERVTRIIQKAKKPIHSLEDITPPAEQAKPEETPLESREPKTRVFEFKVAMDCEGCSERVERLLKNKGAVSRTQVRTTFSHKAPNYRPS